MVVVAAERESFSRTKAMLAMKRLEFLLSYVETEATQKGRFDSESAYFPSNFLYQQALALPGRADARTPADSDAADAAAGRGRAKSRDADAPRTRACHGREHRTDTDNARGRQ